MGQGSHILPKKIIFKSVLIELIISAPFTSFFFLLMLGFYVEPDITGKPLVDRLLAERVTVVHLWFALFSAAAFFSCMGSLVSCSSRDKDFTEDFENESFVLSMHIIGSIFGILLLLLFIGGFISGNLFPNFNDTGFIKIYHTFGNVQNWAKLFVWSFIAGFSERLMPDLFHNFSKTIEKSPEKIIEQKE